MELVILLCDCLYHTMLELVFISDHRTGQTAYLPSHVVHEFRQHWQIVGGPAFPAVLE